MLVLAAPAAAKVAHTLDDPANCESVAPAPSVTVYRCDDGVPPSGGTNPNPGGVQAVTVPARYAGYVGLPPKARRAQSVPGADARGNVALDVDLTLPTIPAPSRGYPLLVLMHGCCSGNKTSWQADSFDASGEKWHYSDSWFAAHGYAVLTYTARGFVNSSNRGSTGQTQLDSRRYEINDFQSLACQIDGVAARFDDVTGTPVSIDPRRVVTTGGSYGGGFSWLALTDPTWHCPKATGAAGTKMKLAATAPKYGWTDLVYSLIPTGTHRQEPEALPAFNGCDSGPRTLDGRVCPKPRTQVGIPKRSIIGALYASGNLATGDHTTFPKSIHRAFSCVSGVYPPRRRKNPACRFTIEHTLPQFLRDRSAYYQNRFFRLIGANPSYRIPVFNAATFTDPLFPPVENRRMTNRLRSVVQHYPIQTYHGDYQHFTQNKPTVWGDLCGTQASHHICTVADYPGGDYDSDPPTLLRTGVTTRLDRFIDHYARPPVDPDQPTPRFNVTAELQVCPENAADLGVDPDDPGPQFHAPTFEQLAPNTLHRHLTGNEVTTSEATPNEHAAHADPVFNLVSNGGKCPVETTPAGPGVATYTTDPLSHARTMIGATRVATSFQPSPGAKGVELNARLYDVYPNGDAVMVDRGPHRLTPRELSKEAARFELHGNGWRFEPSHQIRIELAQDDDPFVARSDLPSGLVLHGVDLRIPVR